MSGRRNGRSARMWAVAVSVALFVASGCAVGSQPGEPSAPRAAPPSPAAERPAPEPGATNPSQPAEVASRQRVQVLSVTDGDTIRVSIDGRSVPVRYIGMNAPETVDPRQPVQCFGKEASDANKRLVGGKFVELEKDVSERDVFDRLLRYVYVDVAGRGAVMVNEELVRGGFAAATTYPPDVKYQERLRAAEGEARAAGAGLWGSACGAIAPSAASSVAPAAPLFAQPLTVTITSSSYGRVAAATLAGASCSARAVLPSGNRSQAQGLTLTVTAPASGAVSWSYATSSATKPGTGTHTVTCGLAGVTQSASASFTVN